MSWFPLFIPSDQQKLVLLDWFLHGLHLVIIIFVLTGWMIGLLRRMHLAALAIVWLSWLGLGLYVGNLGYCILTDWQWQVKAALGENYLPPSYLEYIYWRITRENIDDILISWGAAVVLLICTLISLHLNYRRK